MKTFVLAVVFLVAATAAGAQSLGDVARQEEARRKAVAAPGKVYTNESLKAVPPSTPSTAAPVSSQPAAPATPSLAQGQKSEAKPAPPVDEAKTEAFWRQRMKEARDGLARSQTFAEALQSRINALSTDFVNRDDPAQRSAIETDRQKAIAELERVRREISQYQKVIEDTQEEARKAGIPPGWLR
jgi:hypothetical protein